MSGSPRGRPDVAGTALLAALLLAAPAPAAGQADDPSPGFDVLSYDFSLSLWRGADSIRARQEAAVRLTGTPDALRFHLAGLRVDSARVAGRRVRPRREGEALWLPLPGEGARAGDTVAVEIAYGGRPADGLILRENLHGRWTAFADNWPDRARGWFASVDHPADKATVTFRLEVPAGWTTVANGARVEEVPVDGRRSLEVWRQEAPIPVYTMVVGAGRLAEVRGEAVPCRCGAGGPAGEAAGEARGPEVPTAYYLFPEDRARAEPLFGQTDEMVAFFDRRIAPFPYAKLAMVQSATRYGGMENAGAIFFPEEPVSRGTLGETVVAHEVAHQWFGDAVTEARWSHLWLSEGFATWLAAAWLGHRGGEEAYRREMARLEEAYLASDVVGRPVLAGGDDLMALLNANNYQKGAWVLHMLRATVGDAAFWDGLRRYYRAHRDGTALTGDLRRAMEAASGRELAWFFDQWLRRAGHPAVEVAWSWDEGPGELVLHARQDGRWSEEAPYRLTVPVRVRTAEGRRTVELELEGEEASVRVSLPSAPASVVADPANLILGPVRTR